MAFQSTWLFYPKFFCISIQTWEDIDQFISKFKHATAAINVLAGGGFTRIKDWPGRPTIGRGFGHSGPVDPLAFRIANSPVGSSVDMEGFYITLSDLDLSLSGCCYRSLCGAEMEAKLDGKPFPMWRRAHVKAGQRVTIVKTIWGGCRSYRAVYGGS